MFLYPLLFLLRGSHAHPASFPKSANALWYTTPGNTTLWSTTMLPTGNGYLGAMSAGLTEVDATALNIESLWTGGPFADPSYNGGNHPASDADYLKQSRANYTAEIFASANGTIPAIDGWGIVSNTYGGFSGAGWIVVNRTGSTFGNVTAYERWLDLDSGVVRANWQEGGVVLERTTVCSNPSKACTLHTSVSKSGTYGASYTFAIDEGFGVTPLPVSTCFDSHTIQLRSTAGSPGMLYELQASLSASPTSASISCANGVVSVSKATEAWITWVGDTEYSIDAGTPQAGYTFKGQDPHLSLVSSLSTASKPSFSTILAEHSADYSSTFLDSFSFSVPYPPSSLPTDEQVAAYTTDIGNTHLEMVLFNFGRFMLWASARGVLPANLQGVWAKDTSTPWSGDYHANINLQMNYWPAEATNMGDTVTKPLFDYMLKTWVPRGEETASVMYNASGWTTHDEMNIFGHTGMKWYDNSSAEWANYPMSGAWMMLHVYDHLDFTSDTSWYQSTGYPLLKGFTQFAMDRMIRSPLDGQWTYGMCNSPEQLPITYGCAHWLQLAWMLFNAVEKGWEASGDGDEAFLDRVKSFRASMDMGLKIGSWGQLQEWGPDLDSPTDTHRHLSHLIGLYPGYAISSFTPSLQPTPGHYSPSQLLDATKTSLIHRGNGTGPDADSGWEKVWRAACWAQFGNKTEFYHELSYAVERDFAVNLFSVYNPFDPNPLFQIDANFGYVGAVMNALIQAPDQPTLDLPITVTLLPALPTSWGTGSIKGARVRGGMSVDMTWNGGVLKSATVQVVSPGAKGRSVIVVDGSRNGKVLGKFTTKSGMTVDLL